MSRVYKGAKARKTIPVMVQFEKTSDSTSFRYTFNATFRRVSNSERKSLIERAEQQIITDFEFLQEIIVDWDLKDAEDNEVPFSVEELDGLIENVVEYRTALVGAGLESLVGKKALEAKN